MQMGLKDTVKPDDTAPVTLAIERKGGTVETLAVHAPAHARPTGH